jgi:hypothetical protein
MCRKAKSCALLGNEPGAWDNHSPLRPPSWFEVDLFLFSKAVERAASGDRVQALEFLDTIRSDEMRYWFDEHGQVSGGHRVRNLGIALPPVGCELDPVRNLTPAGQKTVFQRDGYKCRYCGIRVVPMEVLVAFEKAVGKGHFRTVGKNIEQHGIIHGFKVVADHVVPHKLGGRSNMANLVTSCPGCNYGKESYTIEQLGIEDPRMRPPQADEWDGLVSFIPGLKKHQMASDETDHEAIEESIEVTVSVAGTEPAHTPAQCDAGQHVKVAYQAKVAYQPIKDDVVTDFWQPFKS